MNLRHPFEWLPISVQKRAIFPVFLLMLVVLAGLVVLGWPLMIEVAPLGIVSFQLAGELPLSLAIVESWGRSGQVNAGLSLGLDYLFLFAYASFIGLGCVLLARCFSQRIAALYVVGILLAWAVFGAALLDALENYALIRILLGTQRELWPSVALWSAIPKFLIIAIGTFYLVISIILGIMTIRQERKQVA